MDKNSRIYISGHRGMVGAAITRRLQSQCFGNLITRTYAELDLTEQHAVRRFFEQERPQWVFLAAARVGGIHANDSYPAEFIYQNLMIEANVIEAAWRSGAKRLLFLGSSCIYPRQAQQPMAESELLRGTLEPTNEPYAVAKIAGIKLCESFNRQYHTDFRSVMPTNLYGPGDNFNLENSHVIPALLRKFHEAKTSNAEAVEIWGSGTPRREFLHVDDMAAACVFVMQQEKALHLANTRPMESHLNVGTGTDISIGELAQTIARIVGFTGELRFDADKPDGTPRKLLDVARLRGMGWNAEIDLEAGLRSTYAWFLEHVDEVRD
jgi:GDP-L-fucose synthase